MTSLVVSFIDSKVCGKVFILTDGVISVVLFAKASKVWADSKFWGFSVFVIKLFKSKLSVPVLVISAICSVAFKLFASIFALISSAKLFISKFSVASAAVSLLMLFSEVL